MKIYRTISNKALEILDKSVTKRSKSRIKKFKDIFNKFI
jgi:hypothetical protein